MDLLHIITLAIVQGITEFLPVSSSAHLVLVPKMTDWPDQGLIFDVAVHVGTLGGVMIYFWRDVWSMIMGLIKFPISGTKNPGGRLIFLILIATLPIIGAGYYLDQKGTDFLRRTDVIAYAAIGFGVLLFFADKTGLTIRRIEHMKIPTALSIGMMQVLALIPGTSRSGITMTMSRFLGYERPDAARFSILLSIPTIIAAGSLKGWQLYQTGNIDITRDILMAAGLSCAASIIAIFLMMEWLKRATFTPFVIYRIALGIALLYWF